MPPQSPLLQSPPGTPAPAPTLATWYDQQLLATEERIAERILQDTLRIAHDFYRDLPERFKQMESRLLEGGSQTTIKFEQPLSPWGLYERQINTFLEEFFASKGFAVIPYRHNRNMDDGRWRSAVVILEFRRTISKKITEKFKEVLQENKDNEPDGASEEEPAYSDIDWRFGTLQN